MKKTFITASEALLIAVAVTIVVFAVCALTDNIFYGGKASVQPALAADVDESFSFDVNDVDSLRSALRVIYTNKHGYRTAVAGYTLSTLVEGELVKVSINYNGLTTTLKINLAQA